VVWGDGNAVAAAALAPAPLGVAGLLNVAPIITLIVALIVAPIVAPIAAPIIAPAAHDGNFQFAQQAQAAGVPLQQQQPNVLPFG
jgi:multisubunit Na+/H+ antiporter MnhG subunit